MSRSAFVFLVIHSLLTSCKQETPKTMAMPEVREISLLSELRAFSVISALPQYPDDSISAEVSTYDPTWKNDDGFSGKYSFVRKNPDSTLVLFEVKGPGVITRFHSPIQRDDTLDFFLDGALKPTFSVKYNDLFSGRRYPFVGPLCGSQVGGNYCYLPIPFQKDCRIVLRAKKTQFHQINYRLFPVGTRVKTFDPILSTEEKNALTSIADHWNRPGISFGKIGYADTALFETETQSFRLAPGESHTILDLPDGGRITGIQLTIDQPLEKNVDLRIIWDNEKTPAVYCPVSDFFGYAFGTPSMQSLLLGRRGSVNYSFIPMPFDKHAFVELINRNEKTTVGITTRLIRSAEIRNPQREGKFYTYWNPNTKSRKGEPHLFLDVKGQGHLIATMLQGQGLKAGMTSFFEGDDSIAVDGVCHMRGTGSEDYYNGGWYAVIDRWEGRMSLPLSGALEYSLPYCRTGGYRFFLSDKVGFRKSLYHTIEHGPEGNSDPVNYTSVAMYYGDNPPAAVTAPSADLTKIYVPDTLFLYPQLMDFNMMGNVNIAPTWIYNTGGDSYKFTVDRESLIRIGLKELPYGHYNVFADIVRQPDGCDFSFWQRQTQISDWFSAYAPKEAREFYLKVGNVEIGDFKTTISMQFKTNQGKNSLLLNRLIFVKN